MTSEDLTVECRVLTRYLLSRSPSSAVVERYARACAAFAPPGRIDVLRFALRNPWAIGPLDAACGFLDPTNELRKRLLLLSAILETTTEHADRFLPRPRALPLLLLELGYHGTLALLKLLLGVILLPIARSA